ncbi:MAG: hypothetical protein K9M57_03270 [Phycisphaerae bacterium]|nr:hypothetical protein [Phycisphaerae bacterium]
MEKRGWLSIILLTCGILAGIGFSTIFQKQPPVREMTQSETQTDFFPVYGYDREVRCKQILYYVRIPSELLLYEKLLKLADSVSRFPFGGRTLQVKKPYLKDGKMIVTINMQENKEINIDSHVKSHSTKGGSAFKSRKMDSQNTYDAGVNIKIFDQHLYQASWFGGPFQGSAGGSATRYTLLETFLQPDYKGQWIDGIEFRYNGKKLPEQIAHLTLGESPYFRN